MSGAKIFVGVAMSVAALAYIALFGGEGWDIERGKTETDRAFIRIEEEFRRIAVDYEYLLEAGGLRLSVKTDHEILKKQLAALRSKRLAILDDVGLDRREKLPTLRALVEDADLLLSRTVSFRRRVESRVRFMKEASPLLARTKTNATRLETLKEDGSANGTRISELNAAYSQLYGRTQQAEHLLNTNPAQGELMASSLLSELRTLAAEQEALLRPTDG